MTKEQSRDAVSQLPDLGMGLGLRSQHFNHILTHRPTVDWFEVISENFMDTGGRPRHILRQIAEHYPLVMHGVSLSIGSTDPIDFNYLQSLKRLATEIQPHWISDHLCWTGVLGINSHDLLPVPLNEKTLEHISHRILQVQDYLERPLILENPSTYLTYQHSTLPEWEFLRFITEETGCGLLLDVNNVYVSAFNNDFDALEYINGLPHDRIVQMHLAGHQNCGNYIIDTHDSPVIDPVWELFSVAWQKIGTCSLLLEWDADIPEFDVYHAEILKAKNHMKGFSPSRDVSSQRSNSKIGVSNPISFMVEDTGAMILDK